ncbi:MAG: rRNA maturation RNase YbeY [Candidatus Kaiserbacteria bacterium]|nr:rRNA maturation RNase YbeY [Candidatus Kaiserbacteria bacterium]
MAKVRNIKRVAGVAIRNLTRASVGSRAVFSAIANEVLPDWDISLVFISQAKARELNKQLRNKDYTPQVLSYIVGKKSGEIFICPTAAVRQASSYRLSTTDYILLLFIHGALHIKGWAHGATMERCERKLLATYVTTRSDRH